MHLLKWAGILFSIEVWRKLYVRTSLQIFLHWTDISENNNNKYDKFYMKSLYYVFVNIFSASILSFNWYHSVQFSFSLRDFFFCCFCFISGYSANAIRLALGRYEYRHKRHFVSFHVFFIHCKSSLKILLCIYFSLFHRRGFQNEIVCSLSFRYVFGILFFFKFFFFFGDRLFSISFRSISIQLLLQTTFFKWKKGPPELITIHQLKVFSNGGVGMVCWFPFFFKYFLQAIKIIILTTTTVSAVIAIKKNFYNNNTIYKSSSFTKPKNTKKTHWLWKTNR